MGSLRIKNSQVLYIASGHSEKVKIYILAMTSDALYQDYLKQQFGMPV